MSVAPSKAVFVLSVLACVTVIGMLGIFLVTGVGQDPLQYVHPPQEYARLLTANPQVLRAAIGLDNFFIVFYSSVFVLLGGLLSRDPRASPLSRVAIPMLLLLSFLDMVENFHFLTMISAAEEGMLPTSTEIGLQVWESLLKFHVGYLGLFLFGLSLPRVTAAGRLLSNLSLFVQMPVGILIYIAPRALAVPLVFVRFGYFLAALILVARLFGREPVSVSVEAGSGVPA